MTFIPLTISLISLILLSVFPAVSTLSLPNCFPTHAAEFVVMIITYFNNINILTLKRHKWDQENSSHQSTGTNLVAEDCCHNDQLQGTSPQVVVEKDSGVKPEIRTIFIISEIFYNKANLLTSFERRFTICPMVVWPKAELESLRAFL